MTCHTTPTHPSSRAFLSSLAVKHGLFPSTLDAQRWLESDEYDYEVTRAYQVARRLGVTGVPFFVFGGRWAASGVVGLEAFRQGDCASEAKAQQCGECCYFALSHPALPSPPSCAHPAFPPCRL